MSALFEAEISLFDFKSTFRFARPHEREGEHSKYRGRGPVPGVSRSYRYRYNRRMRTQAERRLNGFADTESGEISARASRCGINLPSAWDDKRRHIERYWKSQHRGRKSWDR